MSRQHIVGPSCYNMSQYGSVQATFIFLMFLKGKGMEMARPKNLRNSKNLKRNLTNWQEKKWDKLKVKLLKAIKLFRSAEKEKGIWLPKSI